MRTALFTVVSCSLLAACSGGLAGHALDNPLTAARYGDELADTLANFIIMQDPLASQPGMTEYLNGEIAKAKRISTSARERQAGGYTAFLLSQKHDIAGEALYLDDVLYLSSDFLIDPGPELHVFLTAAVDPRDVPFPDMTAVDLGVIRSPYGAQSYEVPPQDDPQYLRTVVFWDAKLKTLYGFGQLDVGGR